MAQMHDAELTHMGERSRVVHRRLVVLALSAVLGVTLVGLAPVPRAAAQSGARLVGGAWKVQLRGPNKLCKGKSGDFSVMITRFGIYDNGTGVLDYQPWGNLAGNVTISGERGPVSGTVGPNGRQFTYSWPTTGAKTLTATVTALPGLPGRTVDPDSIQVEVIDCTYRIQQLSVWYHMPEGWVWWVGAVVPPTYVVVDPSGQPARAIETLDGFAIPTRRECAVTTTVTGVNALFSITLPRSDLLHYEVRYTPGNADTEVVCNGMPGGNPHGPLSIDAIEKDLQIGDICWPLPSTCFARGWPIVSIHQPHVAHAISDLEGVTYIILERK